MVITNLVHFFGKYQEKTASRFHASKQGLFQVYEKKACNLLRKGREEEPPRGPSLGWEDSLSSVGPDPTPVATTRAEGLLKWGKGYLSPYREKKKKMRKDKGKNQKGRNKRVPHFGEKKEDHDCQRRGVAGGGQMLENPRHASENRAQGKKRVPLEKKL